MPDPTPFVPLRTDPPPELAPTMWLRSALGATIAVTALAVLVADGAAGTRWAPPVPVLVATHALVVGLLVAWSGRAIGNVGAILPPTRYGPVATGATAGALWVVGFGVAALCAVVLDRHGSVDDEAAGPTVAAITVVLVGLLAAWSPFRYHLRHATRLGVPPSAMVRWFWVPLGVFVAGLVVVAATSPHPGGSAGSTEGAVGIGAVHGLATAAFAWTTWRAVTVFDEVIDLRWERWRTEWERTLADMVAQPPPPPEHPVG